MLLACLIAAYQPPANDLDFVKLQVLGPEVGVDFTFTLDNNANDNNNPHLNFLKVTVLRDMEQKIGIRGKK